MPATLKQVRTRIEKSGGDPLVTAFAEILFEKSDPRFLEAFDPESLSAMAAEGFAFLDSLAHQEMSVDVFNPTFEADGWEAPYTVLRLCLRDRPFIVDSVRAELRRREFGLDHLLHPIYSVRRDDGGAIVELAGRQREGRQEAFEIWFLEREEQESRLTDLTDSVRRVLGDVILATSDYQPMREQARRVSDYLLALQKRDRELDISERDEELAEYANFMDWLDDDNFVFLGYREYQIGSSNGKRYLQVAPESGLGILSRVEESGYLEPKPLDEIPAGLRERIIGGRVFTVTKTNAEATVHRPARMDYIGVKMLGVGGAGEEDGAAEKESARSGLVTGEQRFLGLFTSKALSAPVDEIPILRRRLRRVLEIDQAIPESHDYKQITTIFNNMPREELFWSDAEQLHRDIRTIMALEQEREVRLTLRADPLSRGLALMVIMPRERFNAEVRRRVQRFLASALQATHVDYQLAMGEDEEQVRFHFFFTTALTAGDVDARGLEHEVAELARTWVDELQARLLSRHGQLVGRRLAERYLTAFDERYRADISPSAALLDIDNIERLGDSPFRVDLLAPPAEPRGEAASLLRIYHHRRTLVLSDVLPVLENAGLRVLEQISYWARLEDGDRGIDVFRVQDLSGSPLDVRAQGELLIGALEELLAGVAESDRLNRLVLGAGLDIRQVSLLRAYQMYYGQLSAVTSRRFLYDTLITHPRAAAALFDYFRVRFDPVVEGDRRAQLEAARDTFDGHLAEVSSLPEDQALRGLFNLMEATVRTNFFQGKPHISFKISSQQVTLMPEPRPLFEIGVSAPGVEGVHLRGGKVARGGIRWSDRPDDFRTEVLGLMKTQMTKNAVIVPVGSKGGFVLKNAPAEREELARYVRQQYRTYIGGLLDLTDNMVAGESVPPQGLVIYDESDPYLVVAADKGTATFSDLANETAAEYDFWLGDAFASGGSQGYDHKAIGITARGAWECVARHFREMGLDVGRDEFTVAGIGDMSGDVFGNGMLYSDRIRLVAAFNHMHIFLDPKPDAASSFVERRRLFEMPRSTWRDYDTSLISPGGGVFDRSAKAIPLTAEAKELLASEADVLSGQELVKAILRAQVDLLWNGGIGTYVRSSAESDRDVGDTANDLVRVAADELRCRVVGEGGNLGLTQRARVEYALAGGRINTDAIDNAAGVDLSDHEVNIKILLRPALASGELSAVQRNRLLREMTDEVSALVLADNYRQSLALSLAEERSRHDPLLFESLQTYLAERGGLDLEVEAMPSARQLTERRRTGVGYTRPELAVLLAYAKMGLYRRLLETDFPDEAHFRHYLVGYFPAQLAERFRQGIEGHPLRREIIATQFTNTVVDILGITFVHRTIRDTGATPVEVIRAALIALEILEVEEFLTQMFALDNEVAAVAQYRALSELVEAVEGMVNWILLSDLTRTPIAEFVATYREPLATLRRKLHGFLPPSERRHYQRQRKRAGQDGFAKDLADEVAAFDYLPTSVGVIDVAQRTGVKLDEAARRFYALGERLSLAWLRDSLSAHQATSKWEKIALGGLIMELRRVQRDLTEGYLRALAADGDLDPEEYLRRYPNLLRRFDQALAEIRDEEALGLASAGVLARLLSQAELPRG
ncbi:MAG: NAD-glutamate dehydrogenase [Trueperaceae bacterium]